MAIEKTMTINGVTGKYWVVTDISWDKFSNKTRCRLNCYKDREAREANVNGFLMGFGRDYELNGILTLAQIYDQIKVSCGEPPAVISGDLFYQSVNV